jgi:hypothetical protein
MPTVYCAAVECKHHCKNNKCKAKAVTLNESWVHTVHQGFKQFWVCKQFEESEQAKEIMKALGLSYEREEV